jgi:hypothetical protein
MASINWGYGNSVNLSQTAMSELAGRAAVGAWIAVSLAPGRIYLSE